MAALDCSIMSIIGSRNCPCFTKNSTTRRSTVPFTLVCFLLVFLMAVLLFYLKFATRFYPNRAGEPPPFNFQLFQGHRLVALRLEVADQAERIDFEYVGEALQDGMNTYLNAIEKIKPQSWSQDQVN